MMVRRGGDTGKKVRYQKLKCRRYFKQHSLRTPHRAAKKANNNHCASSVMQKCHTTAQMINLLDSRQCNAEWLPQRKEHQRCGKVESMSQSRLSVQVLQ
jgi:hypothetical protein